MSQPINQDPEQIHAQASELVKSIFHMEDDSSVELLGTLHRVARLSEALDCQLADNGEAPELSGARWRLMMRLLIEERMDRPDGLTPTVLSHSQRVSKNTISALLRGLEEQGLIQRNLDPKDLRVFRIQLTQAGRDYLMETAPRRIESLRRLLSGLSREEREQLKTLLEKLQHSLLVQLRAAGEQPDHSRS